MARKKQTILQGPTITIPGTFGYPRNSSNVYPQAPKQTFQDKHWILEIFEDKPRTRWEWWREFFVGFAIGWIVSRWFWSSARKRRSMYLDHLGR